MKMRKLKSSNTAQEMQEENNMDRISNLPESLIHHIFSFLDMKHAIQTSLLSRRWRNFWNSLPNLNFEFRRGTGSLQARTKNDFKDFVDRVFILRDHAIIQKFTIVCTDNIDISSRLNTWILGAVKNNVQEVYINIACRGMTRFPPCLFTSKSLTKLEWSNSSLLGKITVPNSIALPSLKTLQFSSFMFDNEYLTNQIFSACPELESLIIRNCDFLGINLSISSAKLKHVTLENCSTYEEVKVMTVKLCAPNLISFHCDDYILSKEYSLEHLSSLIEANISAKEKVLYVYPDLTAVEREMYAQSVVKFMRCLHHVEELTLSPEFFQVLSEPLGLSRTPITQLCNLRCLNLNTLCTIYCIRAINYLLQVSSNVETLSIHFIEGADGAMSALWDEVPVIDTTQFRNLRCLKLKLLFTIECIQAILYLLHTIPVAESIYLQAVSCNFYGCPIWDQETLKEHNTLYSWEAQVTLKCMNQLKLVEMRNVVGSLNELEFLKVLLKIAVVLEKLIIIFSSEHGTQMDWPELKKRNLDFCEKVQKISRASSSCKIVMKNKY